MEDFLMQLKASTLAEWLAFVLGVLQVGLALFNRRANFVAGILSVATYTWLFYEAGLYAESLLNAYYFVISIAGLISWQESAKGSLPVTRTSGPEWLRVGMLLVISFGILYGVLSQYTNSTVPLPDALVTSLAWAGSWLLMKRKLENWLVLNMSNVLAIPLQLSKGMELAAVLTMIYVVLAIAGYFRWRRALKIH